MVRAFGVVVQLFWWLAVVGAVYGLYRRHLWPVAADENVGTTTKGLTRLTATPVYDLRPAAKLAPSAHIRAS
jgi:hypothetical protein